MSHEAPIYTLELTLINKESGYNSTQRYGFTTKHSAHSAFKDYHKKIKVEKEDDLIGYRLTMRENNTPLAIETNLD